MKVRIGPYKSWIGPYQIADRVFFWIKDGESIIDENGNWIDAPETIKDRFGEWLASTWVKDFCNWYYSKKERKINIRIDDYDVWNADNTLALIIVPVLKRLKEKKHGTPSVDMDDIPQYIRDTITAKEGSEDYIWNSIAWEWILDEMIWAFEQSTIDWEEQYHSGEVDLESKKLDNGLYEMIDGPKHTFKVDKEGMLKHEDRMANGRRLFAKYYRSLWD